ncbi:hypothetical protein FFJ24_019655 [Pedobacter sp. KBS0701]|uniref:hypothetical protein n=1 Tax=Pedobacter sp. KBS0701 TaxID=2578106 RepID=UPI00110E291D|nr:hypothetical protein [Pedobacter sp. KBS0701]QDW26912.1 hypothetical protein FFJ24_019655 [Pedobacter sp. KBS0701]
MDSSTYYISSTDGNDTNSGLSATTPFKTISPINVLASSGVLSGSDTILFKREDVFPGMVLNWNTNSYTENIQIATYGNGNKPLFDMYKYINSDSWILHSTNIWKVDLSDNTKFTGWTANNSGNVGFLKVNDEIFGMKKKLLGDLSSQWDFWDDVTTVYVFSVSNPGVINGSGTTEIAISVRGTSSIALMRNADVYDIAIIGHGAHAISAASTFRNLSYNHLDIREIGGSTLTSFTPNPTVRYGNGIELNGGGKDAIVQGCYFENIYDVAMTCQEDNIGVQGFENIIFRHNRTKKAEQAFELYTHNENSFFRNIKFHDNICEESGYGPLHFGHQSGFGYPQFLGVHILLQDSYVDMDQVEIYNNTFDRAANGLYFWLKTNPLAQKKFVNSHSNDIYLYAGQKIQSVNETWKIEDHQQFVLDTGLEVDSNFYVIPQDISGVVEILREQIAQGSKVTTVGDSLRDVLSLAYNALIKSDKNTKRLDRLPIASDNLKVATTSFGNATDTDNWTRISEITLQQVAYRDFSLTLGFNTASGDMQSAKVTFSVKQSSSVIISPATMAIDVETIGGFARTQFLTEDGFKITNDGFGTSFNIYIKRSNNFSSINVFELGKYIPAGTIKYFSNQPWLSIEPSAIYNHKSAIKDKPVYNAQATSTATPGVVVRRDNSGGILQSSLLLQNLPNGWNDARTANIVYQAVGITITGEPLLNFNGLCEYLGDSNKGIQSAYDSSGTVVYQRVYWFGTWRPWLKMLNLSSDLKGQNIVNIYRTASDSDYSIMDYNSYHLLPAITADRTLGLPPTYQAKSITIFNTNNTIFKWITSIRIIDNNGVQFLELPSRSVITLVSTNDNTLWRISNVYTGNNSTIKYNHISTTYTLMPALQNEMLVMDGLADYTVSIARDVKTPAGVVKIFKNVGDYIITILLEPGVMINDSNTIIKVFPNQELVIISQSESTWKITSGPQTIKVNNTTDTVNKSFLNTTYPYSRYGLNTRVIYSAQLFAYERISPIDWTIMPINLLT